MSDEKKPYGFAETKTVADKADRDFPAICLYKHPEQEMWCGRYAPLDISVFAPTPDEAERKVRQAIEETRKR